MRESLTKEWATIERKNHHGLRMMIDSPGYFCRRGSLNLAGLIGGVVVLLLFARCAVYSRMSTSADTVRSGGHFPDIGALSVLASEMFHPALAPVSLRPAESLSPDGAAVLAVLLNPSLRGIRDHLGLSRAQLFDVGLLPNPELTSDRDEPLAADSSGRVNAFGLELTRDVTTLIHGASRKAGASPPKEAIVLEVAWQEWQVAQAAKAAAYQLASLQSQIVLAERTYQGAAHNLTLAHHAFTEGSMTATDFGDAQATNRLAREKLVDRDKQADRQRAQLRQLLGLPIDAPIRVRNDLELPSTIEPATAPGLLQGLEQRRLDLLALRRGCESREAGVRAAILEQFPKIRIQPTISRDSAGKRTTGYGLAIELPIFDRNQGKTASGQATRQQLIDEYLIRLVEAQSDLAVIVSVIQFTKVQIAAAESAETTLGRSVEHGETALSDGRTDPLNSSAAWIDRVGTQMKIAELKGKLSQAMVALELTTGFYHIPKPNPVPPNPTTVLWEESTQ